MFLNIFVTILVLVFALAGAEVFLRLLFPLGSPVHRLDQELLSTTVPGAWKYFERQRGNGGERILVRMNSQGFRGDELRNEPGLRRIAVYGDSLIEGEYSSLGSTFVKRFESYLTTNATEHVEAVNAGVVGYGPDQAFLKMKREIPGLNPDAIVLSVYADNDFGDLIRNKLFKLGTGDELKRNNQPIIGDSLREELTPAGGPLSNLQLGLRLMRVKDKVKNVCGGQVEEHPSDMFFKQYLMWTRGEYNDYVVNGDDVVRTVFNDIYDADISTEPGSDSAKYKIRLMEKLLQEVKAFSEKYRLAFVLLIVPSPVDACEGYPLARGSDPGPTYKGSRLSDAFQEIAERNRIAFLNLYPVFKANSPCELYFQFMDDHWNDRGQDLAASVLARYFEEHRLPPFDSR